MNDKFLAIGGMFAKEIINKGIVLYEADDERVAWKNLKRRSRVI